MTTVARSHVFIGNAHYAIGDLRAWGWVVLILGVLQLLAMLEVLAGNQIARWFGVAVIGLNTIFAGLKGLAMLAIAVAAAVVSLAAAYVFLSRRSIVRWLSLAVFVLAPIAVIIVYAFRQLLWVAIVTAAVWLLASITARLALTGDQEDHSSSRRIPSQRSCSVPGRTAAQPKTRYSAAC